MFCIVGLPAGPCEPTATVVTVMPPALSALIVLPLGAAGSPSLAMIMCLFAASVHRARPATAFFMLGSKSGMSPIAIRSIFDEHHLPVGADADHAALAIAPTAIDRCCRSTRAPQ